MTFQNADSISLLLFVFLGLINMSLVILAFKKSKASWSYYIGYFIFIFFASVFALTGLLRSHIIPLLPLYMFSVAALAVFFSRFNFGKEAAKKFSFAVLVGFQIYRLPLELILHHWANMKVIPETLTWSGQNWDIFTGILALLLMPFVNRFKFIVWVFQIIGSVLLLNVIRVIIFSLPLPISWNLEVPLQLPFEFPYCLIVPLYVWPAITGHLIIYRKLLTKSDRAVTPILESP